MSTDIYDCDYKVNDTGMLPNYYTGIYNTTCTYCDAACTAPNVDGTVAFFDGFSGNLVLVMYAYLILFSIVITAFKCYFSAKEKEEDRKKE